MNKNQTSNRDKARDKMEYIGIEDLVLERKIYVGAYNVACTFIRTDDSFCMVFVPFCSLLAVSCFCCLTIFIDVSKPICKL